MSKRLETLEKMTASGQADAFAWYALAMEYRREGRMDDALRTFEALRSTHPDYLPMYLMAGQMLSELEQDDAARPWLEQGIALARERGDAKATGELEALLATCDER
jgi:tetratricopeptide (TPR) repeat protein